ncbi:ATP-binding protein [Ferruginibacter paludis]|uniref:AAA family ATPase n=1 Tax=Ferruginibacter paludis TaxID=1310417 RepID=UPI0025B507B5|nr:ATP-binding protein [Ferruginibacter paludis]MDN3655411.1 ATP-binding protein [Ferruginibacter paludis]
MILNFFIKNYRSFKDDVTFSLIAEASKSKENNVFNQVIGKAGDEIRLLNTAMIYGANASGKSNLIKAVFAIVNYIGHDKLKVGESILLFSPFKFDIDTAKAPTEFYLEFIGNDTIKYKYEIKFDNRNVIEEQLIYWPQRKPVVLLSRNPPDNSQSIIHRGKIKDGTKSKTIDVFHNQTLMSKFGGEITNEIINLAYLYISKLQFIDAFNTNQSIALQNQISKLVSNDSKLLDKINALVKLADTGLNSIKVLENDLSEIVKDLPSDIRKLVIGEYTQFQYSIFGRHSLFNNFKLINSNEELPFADESNGTKAIFSLGGKMLDVIENGQILFIDELETSLHPFLSKLLVSLFQNKRINKKNAQLIFTTHDTNLLDKTMFRRDQIWFAEKNEIGATSLYSLQDFNEVREDTPFDKWYLAGKFGGIPNISSLENLYHLEEKS